MHTHSYKRPTGFEDKRIVVVGIGNSGVDAAVELGLVGSQVYLSTRRGAWILHRVGDRGYPIDYCMTNRMYNLVGYYLGPNFMNWYIESSLNARFDHEKYGLKPDHRFFSAHPTVNDALPNLILSGRVKVKGNIKEFTKNGVIFERETEETPCDAVVLATGYEIYFPFLDQSILPVIKNKVELFKNVFNPRLPHPHTLGIIGLVQPLGAIFPIAEIQARWFVQLMAGEFRSFPFPLDYCKSSKFSG